MKRFFTLIFVALSALVLAGCAQEQPDGAEYLADNSLGILSRDVFFQPAGGTGSIVVDTDGTVTASSNKDWLTVSVNGSTVELTAAKNPDIQSRYAEVTIKSGESGATVIAQQYGYKTVSFTGDDIVASGSSQTHSFLYTYEDDMVVSSDADWITASVTTENGQQSVKIELAENGTGAVRTGQVSWELGMESGVINVKQFPNFAVNEAWTMEYVRDEGTNSIFDVEGVEGSYLVGMLTQAQFKSKYDGSFETFAFDVAAAADPTALFDHVGEIPWAYLAVGIYEAILVGVDENNDPTGEYNYYEIEITRENEKSAYEKWLGKWEVTYVEYEYNDQGQKTGEKEVTHTWEIKQQEADASFTISGVSSTSNEFGDVVATFDKETGALMVAPQLTLETTYSGNPDLYYFCAMFGENSLLPTGEDPIFTAELAGDVNANLTPGTYNGETFHSASTLNYYNERWYLTTGKYNLPNTMKKIEDGEGGGGGGGGDDVSAYDKWIGSWSIERQKKVFTDNAWVFDGEPATDTWVIAEKVKDESYTITGMYGRTYPVEAVFDATTGGFSVVADQEVGTVRFQGDDYDCTVFTYGYLLHTDGKVYRITSGSTPYTIFSAKLSSDNEGPVTPGQVNIASLGGVLDLGAFRFAALDPQDGKYYGFDSSIYLYLPNTLKRAAAGAPARTMDTGTVVRDGVVSTVSGEAVRKYHVPFEGKVIF